MTTTMAPEPLMIPPNPVVEKKEEKFDWLDTLEDLAKGRSIDSEQHCALVSLATDWPTCACGQLCKNLPRDKRGIPRDEILRHYGALFAGLIQDREWTKALTCFKVIEARTDHLLNAPEDSIPDEA